jgi:uncharacterized membrane protein
MPKGLSEVISRRRAGYAMAKYICKNILKVTIIWHNELFNGKELKAKHMIFLGLFILMQVKTLFYYII